jgi:aspartyl-tRNA(Asn)/glutamyl-tRNA(Gln) amidotransferase subunit C
MSKITRDDVLKLAKLSKLQLSDSEIKRFTNEIGEIMTYVEQLQSVDVSGLQPTDQVTGLVNVMREDEVVDYQAKPKDLIKITPSKIDNQIKVKRVLN